MKDLKYLLSLFIVVTISLIATSCSDDKDDEPSAVTGKVTITNNSTYTLPDFVVIFSNDSHETITREEKGTLKPKDVITVDIPIGATIYYMGTMQGNYRFWSPDYATSVRTQVLTDQIVGNWSN